MRFKLEIECDNEAFADGGEHTIETAGAEVVRILKKIVWHIEGGREDGPIVDINGNKVGEWGFEDTV